MAAGRTKSSRGSRSQGQDLEPHPADLATLYAPLFRRSILAAERRGAVRWLISIVGLRLLYSARLVSVEADEYGSLSCRDAGGRRVLDPLRVFTERTNLLLSITPRFWEGGACLAC